MPRKSAFAFVMISVAASANAQSFKPVVNGPVIPKVSTDPRLNQSTAIPKPNIAISAQNTLNLGSPPPVAEGAVLDVLHLDAANAQLDLENANIYHVKVGLGTVAQLTTNPGSGWRITYKSVGKAQAFDCGLMQASGAQLLPVSFKVSTLGIQGLTVVGEGSAQILSNRAVSIVPAYPTGTEVKISFFVAKNGGASSQYYFTGCKIYQLG